MAITRPLRLSAILGHKNCQRESSLFSIGFYDCLLTLSLNDNNARPILSFQWGMDSGLSRLDQNRGLRGFGISV